jgi:hypothetical protein
MKIRRMHSGLRWENIHKEENLENIDRDGRLLLLKSTLET